jgi:GNAT superfamily N-acetyltransferase
MTEPVAQRPSVTLRREVDAADIESVRAITRATGFFSAEEISIAVELVEARLHQGAASGYSFLFAERAGQVIGYACYGPIPLTASSYDLYWIVVHPEAQGGGIGRLLLAEVEAAVAGLGGTRLYIETSSRPQYAPTRAFYRRAAYREAALLEDFYAPGDGKLVFEKRLASAS